MKSFYRVICHVLIASIISLPHGADAEMIGTDQALATVEQSAKGDMRRDLVSRESVASQLQAMGVAPSMARERVGAMTQDEVNQLAGNIDTLPAAGISPWAVVFVVLFVAGIAYDRWGPDQTWRNRPL